MSDIEKSRDYVLAQAKANIDFVMKSPGNIEQAKQVNSSLAAIVAMERNVVMDRAISRMRKGGFVEVVQRLPES
jgi:hypothetical protein